MTDPRRMLRNVFAVNAVATGASGAALVAGAAPLAPLAGLPGPAPLLLLGAGFLAFALFVWSARREPLDLDKARAVFLMDAAYVVLSFGLVLGWPGALSPMGRLATAMVADLVALFAILEYVGLRRARRSTAGAAA